MTPRPIMPIDSDEVAALKARIKELEARVERDTDKALERLTAPRISDDGFWCVNCGCYSISRHPQDFRFQHRVRPMTEFRREALIDIQRYVDHLREAVEAKRINESSIYRLVEGYLDQPGYYPQERVQLLAELQARGFPHSRDALALWRFAEGPEE